MSRVAVSEASFRGGSRCGLSRGPRSRGDPQTHGATRHRDVRRSGRRTRPLLLACRTKSGSRFQPPKRRGISGRRSGLYINRFDQREADAASSSASAAPSGSVRKLSRQSRWRSLRRSVTPSPFRCRVSRRLYTSLGDSTVFCTSKFCV